MGKLTVEEGKKIERECIRHCEEVSYTEEQETLCIESAKELIQRAIDHPKKEFVKDVAEEMTESSSNLFITRGSADRAIVEGILVARDEILEEL